MQKKIEQLKAKAGGKQDMGAGKNVVAVLDIGSSKICCFIAETGSHGAMEVIGIGHQASRGVKSGGIIDLRAAETAVAYAVESAETMARERLGNQPIKSVYVNIAGTHALSHQLSVDVKISGHDVSDRDIKNALGAARGVAVPGKDELIHVIPSSYSIDKQRGIQEPRGMTGETLGVNITAVTALISATRNIATVAHQNHLEVDGFCAAPYAAGLATLADDEAQLGCTVIDMGGGTTSIGVFFEGKLVFTASIPVGGNHVTSDIARGLTTSLTDAERIKTLYGAALATGPDDSAIIDVPPIGEEEHSQPNYVARSLLTGIIQPRIEETFELVRAKLVDSGINNIAGRRVVLTGGASQLPGLCDIAKIILDKQIRLGRPRKIKGLAEATGGPSFSAAVGLLNYAAGHAADEMPRMKAQQGFSLPLSLPSLPISFPFHMPLPASLQGNLIGKVTHWLKENW